MTETTTRADRTLNGAPATQPVDLLPPPRLRRRPALVAGAITAICLGAVLAAWAWSASTNTTEVLVAKADIARGTVIAADDLTQARINSDPAVQAMPASEYDEVVGQRAAFDIPTGGLLTPDSVSSDVVPAAGKSVVGLALTPAQAPGMTLQPGDQVRVVLTPGQEGEAASGAPAYTEAEVVDIRTDPANGQRIVDLLVPHPEATLLAARIATGKVALVLDSRER